MIHPTRFYTFSSIGIMTLIALGSTFFKPTSAAVATTVTLTPSPTLSSATAAPRTLTAAVANVTNTQQALVATKTAQTRNDQRTATALAVQQLATQAKQTAQAPTIAAATVIAQTGLMPLTTANASGLTDTALLNFPDRNGPAQVVFSADGAHLFVLTGDSNNNDPSTSVYTYEAKTGNEVSHFLIPADRDRARITADGLHVVMINYDNQLTAYNLASTQVESHQPAKSNHNNPIFSADGTRVAILNQEALEIWDTLRGVGLATLTDYNSQAYEYAAIQFSLDNRLFFVARSDTDFAVYHTNSGTLVNQISDVFTNSTAAFSPDGTLLALAGSIDSAGSSANTNISVHLWNVQTNKLIGSWQSNINATTAVDALSFSPDGRWLTLAMNPADSTAQTYVLDGHTGKLVRTQSWGKPLNFSSDGHLMAGVKLDGTIQLWNADSGYSLITLDGYNATNNVSLMLSPDQTRLISFNYNSLRMWGVPAGKNIIARAGLTIVLKDSGVDSPTVPDAWLSQPPKPPRYQLTMASNTVTITSCAYEQGHTLIVEQTNMLATITDLQTRQVIVQRTFYAKYDTNQPYCESSRGFSNYIEHKSMGSPDYNEFNTWFIATMGPILKIALSPTPTITPTYTPTTIPTSTITLTPTMTVYVTPVPTLPVPTLAQTFSDSALTVKYPAGWTAAADPSDATSVTISSDKSLIDPMSNTLAPGQFVIALSTLGNSSASPFTPSELLKLTINGGLKTVSSLTPIVDLTTVTIGTQPGAEVIYSMPSLGNSELYLLVYYQGYHQVMIIAATAKGEAAANRGLFQAIAASLTFK